MDRFTKSEKYVVNIAMTLKGESATFFYAVFRFSAIFKLVPFVSRY